MLDRTRTSIAALVALAVLAFALVVGISGAEPGWTVRISAASAQDITDSSGKVWLSDRNFVDGTPWNVGSAAPAVGGTSDDALYNKHRWGMSGYDIPVPENATYRVELRFAEVVFSDEGKRVFDINAEGSPRIDNLDVVAEAGYAQALNQTFDVAIADGKLDLDFVSVVEDPMISAISVTQLGGTTSPPPTSVKPFVKRIDSAAKAPLVDSAGQEWSADTGYKGGTAFGPVSTAVGGTVDDSLYQSHRWGLRAYAVNVPSKAEYDVTLHFAEVVFNQPGKRVFDIESEGALKVNDLDVFAQAGFAKALTKTFRVKVTDGVLNVRFKEIVEDPMISALEVKSVAIGVEPPTTQPPTTQPPTTQPPTTQPPTTTTPPPTTTTPPPVSPPPSGTKPTRANTGPRYALTSMSPAQFVSSGVCNRQRIDGEVRLDPSARGRSFTLTDCEINGNLMIMTGDQSSALSLSQMPTFNMDYVDIVNSIQTTSAVKFNVDHSFIGNQPQLAMSSDWSWPSGPYPAVFRNSMFYQPFRTCVPDAYEICPQAHSEAIHVPGWGDGMRFLNVNFELEGGPFGTGPGQGGYTSIINFHGRNGLFDGCWFYGGSQVATYTNGWWDGPGNIVQNSAFDDRIGALSSSYSGTTEATFINNRSINTGRPLPAPYGNG